MDIIKRKSLIGSKIVRSQIQINTDNFKNNKFSWVEKITEGIISFSLAMIFLGLPTFITRYPLQEIEFSKQMGFYFWIIIALLAWLGSCAFRGEVKIRRTPLDFPILFLWLSYLLSTIFSVDIWHSFWGFFGDPTHGLLNATAIIIAYYLILSTFNMNRLRIFLGTIFLSGLVILFWETLIVTGVINLQTQNFLQADRYLQYIPASRVGSVSGTTIFLSIFIILLVTIFLKINSSDSGKIKKIIFGSIILAIIFSCLYLLLAFYFFVPWSGFFLGVGFFLVYIFMGMTRASKGSKWLPSFIFSYIVLAMFLGNIFLSNNKITAVNFPMEVNLERNLSWQIAKETLAKHSFLLGSGPATYGYDFSLYRPQDFNLNNFYNLRFYKGSGIFWETLPTVGILGTLALIFLIFSFLSVTLYLLNRGKEKNQIYSLGFMSATIVILVDAFFARLDGSMIIFGALLATLTLGIILKENETQEEYWKFILKTRPGRAPAGAFIFLAVIMGTIFLLFSLLKFFIADVYASRANKNIFGENSIGMMEKAITLNGKEGRYYTLFGQQYMELANSEFLKKDKADKNLFEKYLDNALNFTFKGKQLMPKDVVALEAFAQALENKALYFPQFSQTAVDAFNDALALEPHNALYFLEIGKVRVREASLEKDEAKKKTLILEAKDWFQKSIDKKDNLAEGYFQLGVAQQLLGEKNEAILSLQKAIILDNTKSDYFLVLANIYQSRGAENDYKIAEDIYKKIISAQGNEPNIYLNLGLLYEKMKRFDDALEQYKKVLNLLPEKNLDAKNKIQKMIDNAGQGIENTVENTKE